MNLVLKSVLDFSETEKTMFSTKSFVSLACICLIASSALAQSPKGKFTVWAFKQQNGKWIKQDDRTLVTDDEDKAREYEKSTKATPGWTASSNVDSVALIGTWKLGQRDFVHDNKDISNYIYLGKDGKAIVLFTGWGDKKPFDMDWVSKGELVIVRANDSTDPISGWRFKREGNTLIALDEAEKGRDYKKITDTLDFPKVTP